MEHDCPQDLRRFLTRTCRGRAARRLCAETIYRRPFAGPAGASYRQAAHRTLAPETHGRGGAIPNKIKNMAMPDQRPAEVTERLVPDTGKAT
jgi:hypothetical protein